jgi:16S rRNA (adenine1518-N6/adenine1519-N6)-dimethyltransferase
LTPATYPPKAKKSLGQNFLQDANIARKIAACLQVDKDDRVLEIGPGPGMLTSFLREAQPARLYMVERDAYWAEIRQRENSVCPGNNQVILADALTMPWFKFGGAWKIAGNLPYNIASPLIWDILSGASGLVRAVFMLQKEVGLRLAAHPGTGAYGALSVWVQSHAKPKLEFTVPPQVFRPIPKVYSAVLSFIPLAPGQRPAHPAKLSRLLKICFQKRRKQLAVILRSEKGFSMDLLEELHIKNTLRPEELSPGDFQRLAARLFGMGILNQDAINEFFKCSGGGDRRPPDSIYPARRRKICKDF